jgi:hypothetical protein
MPKNATEFFLPNKKLNNSMMNVKKIKKKTCTPTKIMVISIT